DLQHVAVVQPDVVQHHVHQRVDLGDGVAGRLRLGPADIGLAVDDLALQVGLVDHVELDDAEGADPGGSQVHQGGRAETAGAHAQNLGVLQPLLAGHRHVRDDQVPAVPAYLIDGEGFGGFNKCWQD